MCEDGRLVAEGARRFNEARAAPHAAAAFIRPGYRLKRRPMRAYLDFEKPVAELEAKIEELRKLAANGDPNAIGEDVKRLEEKAQQALKEVYASLTPWQKTQVARHPERPHMSHYVKALIEDFTPLAGDRYFGEDEAIVGGLGRFRGMSVCVMGQEKGTDTDSRLRHNFGMAKPEGYRKAVRLMELADRFDLPVISLVDTAGAYPGIGAEERGQAEAIARSTAMGLELGSPSVAVVIGEGGSGGAVAIATSNRVLMLEHAIYTVASPEASASILWRDSGKAQDAATNMKITAQDLLRFGVIDGIIKEPSGGAHRDPEAVINATGDAVEKAIVAFNGRSPDEIRQARADKFLAIGRNL
jgi:acetyl-CoA carboxylase carboxyl transferase subunit alpha